MRITYNIANHVVCIRCDDAAIMESMQGFSVFRTVADEVVCPEINIHLEETEPQPVGNRPYYTLKTEVADCVFYQNGGVCEMEMKQNKRLTLSLHYNSIRRECYICGSMSPILLRFALWIAFNLAMVQLKTVAIHASAIICREKAILYLGESGTGKSTHVQLIHQCFSDVELLNDDSPILRIEDGKCMVYGSPWSGKTPCYKQRKVELAGVVRLKQAPYNRISSLGIHESIGALLPSFPPQLYLSKGNQSLIINIISDILEHTNVFLLECLPDEEAAEMSVNRVIRSINIDKWRR